MSSCTNGTVRPLAASPARVTPAPGRIDHHVCDYIARARLKPAAWKHDPRVQNPRPKALAREKGSVRRCSPLTFPESAGAAFRVWVMFGWPARPHCRLRREYAAAQPRRARRGSPGPPPAPGPRHARHWPPGTRPRRPGLRAADCGVPLLPRRGHLRRPAPARPRPAARRQPSPPAPQQSQPPQIAARGGVHNLPLYWHTQHRTINMRALTYIPPTSASRA